ncbi:MAG: sigma-54-dependent Fis family transcriptional regulator [Candidatus Wallbacteria bacterium]|nr:sigma-54-dependent Fis family transcriptional regulator [Candidatus Wallbacteria bacterium]
MAVRQVLIVDDEASIRDVLERGLSGPDFAVTLAGDSAKAMDAIRERRFDVAILDVRMPHIDGIELLKHIKEQSPTTEVIMLTADSTLEMGLQAMRLGAYDYVTKPFYIRAVRELCVKACEKADLRRRATLLERELSHRVTSAQIVGASAPMQRVMDLVRQIAPSASPILITGESGTGKELIAHAVHDLSSRREGAFIAVNCGAFQESLLESELFGHRKGAFTGALFDKPGLFDVADGGTLFLDEVGEMTLAMQVKLLRVLDTRQFRPIGDTRERSADFRLVAATNRDLHQAILEKHFREDLFYRLNVVSVEMPPLRDRLEDIPQLVEYIVAQRTGLRHRRRTTPELLDAFQRYHWPGNIRELVNQVERSLLLSPGEDLLPIGFPPPGHGVQPAWPKAPAAPPAAPAAPASGTLEEQERLTILATLESFKGNVSRTAVALGIDRRTLHRKLKAYRQPVEATGQND